MKTIFSYWFMCMSVSIAPSYAMHTAGNQRGSLADHIPTLIEYLSSYQAVQQTGYLTADGVKSFIGGAQSRVIYPLMCGLDMVIKRHQSGGIGSSPAGFLLSTIKVIPGCSAAIETCEQCVRDDAPISDSFNKVRHIQKYTLEFVSENADQVNHWFSVISEKVGPHMPIILAGLQAMHKEHRRIEVRKKYAALRERGALVRQRVESIDLARLSADNDDENEFAEYKRIHTELADCGYLLNDESVVTVELSLSKRRVAYIDDEREDGMTDWFK